jgi:DNA gyrase subunit A
MRRAERRTARRRRPAPSTRRGRGRRCRLETERIAELGAPRSHPDRLTEGFGKRTSAYEFRRTGRGGQGLLAQD